MNDYQKLYYVYQHIDPITKQCVYIGIGTRDRAWIMRTSPHQLRKCYGGRKQEHTEWFSELEKKGFLVGDVVEIIAKGLSKKQAVELEKTIIKNKQPLFNNVHNPVWESPSNHYKIVKEFAKKLRECGYSYTRVAFLLGADGKESRKNTKAMTIWRWVNG